MCFAGEPTKKGLGSKKVEAGGNVVLVTRERGYTQMKLKKTGYGFRGAFPPNMVQISSTAEEKEHVDS